MKISVCMATFNGEKYIEEQLSSILSQLSESDEVIISDDGSTDSTLDLINAFGDRRVVVFVGQTFKSLIFNFENALSKASGDVVFLADQDDVWKSNKVSVFLEYLKEYDVVVSDAEVVDEDFNILHASFFALNGSIKGFVRNILKNSYLGCAMAFRRKVLDRSLPFPRDIAMHDWWIGIVGEVYGKSFFIDECLISYRRHGDNASATSTVSKFSFFKKIFMRAVMIKNICMRYSGF